MIFVLMFLVNAVVVMFLSIVQTWMNVFLLAPQRFAKTRRPARVVIPKGLIPALLVLQAGWEANAILVNETDDVHTSSLPSIRWCAIV